MIKKEVNIDILQQNLSKILDFVVSGDEIIITNNNIPIAKLSPIENKVATVKASYFSAKVNEARRTLSGEAPENWFG